MMAVTGESGWDRFVVGERACVRGRDCELRRERGL